jgi:hypothetical protein
VVHLVEQAGRHGLVPVGEMSFEAEERPIRFAGREYTFGWLALRKV